jgi:glycosyltransferase involved in cell wall biosynthesis
MTKKIFIVYSVAESLVFLEGQVGYLKAQGYEITLIMSPSPKLLAFVEKNGISHYSLPIERKIVPVKDLLSVVKLSRLFMRHRSSIVHGNTPKGGLLSMIAAWIARVPVRVYTIHGFPFETARGLKNVLLKTTERISCKLSTHVLSVSFSLREVAVINNIVNASKIQVLANGSCNGIDTQHRFNPAMYTNDSRMAAREALKIKKDAMVIGFVGRLVRDKGVNELIKAWKMVEAQLPNMHLLIIGAIDTRDGISADGMHQLASTGNVTWIVETDEIEKYYAVMDLFVLPSYREGLGLVLLEASAMGIAAIASDTTGCKDAVIHTKTGILVPIGDVEALAAAMIKLLADEALRSYYGNNGRRYVQEMFDRRIVWATIDGFYRKLLGNYV